MRPRPACKNSFVKNFSPEDSSPSFSSVARNRRREGVTVCGRAGFVASRIICGDECIAKQGRVILDLSELDEKKLADGLRQERFRRTYVWQDGPNTFYGACTR
jgi:hypothetical protein